MSASIAGPAAAAAESAWRDHEATVLFFACTLWSDLLGPIRERLPIPSPRTDNLVTPVRYAGVARWRGSKF